jgi:peptidyl-prolyl cis-trans isomerase SurA
VTRPVHRRSLAEALPRYSVEFEDRNTEEHPTTMKKSILLSTLLLLAAGLAWGQSLDKPAATVKLIRSEVVTVSQLQKQIAPLEAQAKRALTPDERRQVLDGLIARVLIQQAAERDKVVVSDAELQAKIDDTRKAQSQALNIGRDLTDTEFRQLVQNTGALWDDWVKNLKYTMLLTKYAMAKSAAVATSYTPVTDQDIQDAYDANKSSYFIDDIVTLRHIFIDTHLLTAQADKDKALKRANDILKELQGGALFGDLVMKYSDDPQSKYNGGIFGSLLRSDAQHRQLYGSAFFEAVFKLKKGEVSGVIQSNLGYHLVMVTDRFDAKLLTLDDTVPPANKNTVREILKSSLTVQRQSDAIQTALTQIVGDLKKVAEIKIFDANLTS